MFENWSKIQRGYFKIIFVPNCVLWIWNLGRLWGLRIFLYFAIVNERSGYGSSWVLNLDKLSMFWCWNHWERLSMRFLKDFWTRGNSVVVSAQICVSLKLFQVSIKLFNFWYFYCRLVLVFTKSCEMFRNKFEVQKKIWEMFYRTVVVNLLCWQHCDIVRERLLLLFFWLGSLKFCSAFWCRN